MLLFLCDGIDLTSDPDVGVSKECDNISETLAPCRFSVTIAAWAIGGNVRLYMKHRLICSCIVCIYILVSYSYTSALHFFAGFYISRRSCITYWR